MTDHVARVRRRPAAERTTAGTRRSAKVLARELRDVEPRAVAALVVRLVQEDERQFAYELAAAHRGVLQALRPADVEAMSVGLDGWGPVDHFATYVLGPAWREGRVSDAFVHRKLGSKDRWQRRAAVACTVALNTKARGGQGDSARTLAVCRAVVDDRDDMIVKALSWALRELAKRDRASVERFLAEHEARLAARVLREVRNKLRTGLKNPK
jgi:3-methyladenine DNA glycosylase AlkD